MSRFLLGYQLANKKGEIIHGTDEDPSNMTTFEVLSPFVATGLMRQLNGDKRFLLYPIYVGDIENPEVIEDM